MPHSLIISLNIISQCNFHGCWLFFICNIQNYVYHMCMCTVQLCFIMFCSLVLDHQMPHIEYSITHIQHKTQSQIRNVHAFFLLKCMFFIWPITIKWKRMKAKLNHTNLTIKIQTKVNVRKYIPVNILNN